MLLQICLEGGINFLAQLAEFLMELAKNEPAGEGEEFIFGEVSPVQTLVVRLDLAEPPVFVPSKQRRDAVEGKVRR